MRIGQSKGNVEIFGFIVTRKFKQILQYLTKRMGGRQHQGNVRYPLDITCNLWAFGNKKHTHNDVSVIHLCLGWMQVQHSIERK